MPVLILVDVALATAVFIVLARPDLAIAFALRNLGSVSHEWFQEHIQPEELARLRKVARLGGWVGLLAVFALSFALGTTLALA